jgi:ubiquinone/menaquinone biosynthesis C-methylase UbiE
MTKERAIIVETIERQRAFYDEKYRTWKPNRSVQRVWDHIGKEIIEALEIEKEQRFLFIGAGDGYLAEYIAGKTKAYVVGIDISAASLQICKSNRSSNTEYVFADAQRLPFKDGVFDGVIAPAVLHHLPFIDKALGEFNRLLRAEGRVYSVDPKDHFLRWPVNWILRRIVSEDELQLNPKELVRLYRENGFAIIGDTPGSFMGLVLIPLLKRIRIQLPNECLKKCLEFDSLVAQGTLFRKASWIVSIVAKKPRCGSVL